MDVAQIAQSVLTGLARFMGAQRLYTLEGNSLPVDAAVERWQGWERLSQGYEWWVDVVSADAHYDLDALLGQPATLKTRLAGGDESARSGLIREAACLGADGGLARYRLCLVPWTWWLSQGRHSRVFQDKSVLEIAEAVFADYSPLAVWQTSEEVASHLQAVPPRSYCVQYRENDYAFLTRILAEEGLGWRWEEDAAAAAGHKLVIFADSTQLPLDSQQQTVRFHRADSVEVEDAVQAFGQWRRLGSANISLLSTDYKRDQAVTAQSALGLSDVPSFGEIYDPSGAYAFADEAHGARLSRWLAEANESLLHRWQGQGTVRSARVGCTFDLVDAPALRDAKFLLLGLQHAGVNNLPNIVSDGVEALLGSVPDVSAVLLESAVVDRAAWDSVWAQAKARGYANAFIAQVADKPWRTVLSDQTGLRLNPRPSAPGYQTAMVVADDGAAQQELYCDALGRIKVRFHWQTEGASTAANSCWLRVVQRYAGPGVGTQFLPRVGQEVLVSFLDGDIDRPVVLGALYNGQGEGGVRPTPGGQSASAEGSNLYASASDHAPSAQANLAGGNAPPWHGWGGGAESHRNASALWGVQSKEWYGAGANRLVFDDSDSQLRLQLSTTQAASQLNLGHLIHQADNFRGSFRGQGFELRTDRWGTVRAQAGLWLSAYAVGATSPSGEAVGPTALLKQAEAVAKVFSGTAGTHQTVKLAAHEGLSAQTKSALIDDQAPLSALLTSVRTTVDGAEYETASGQAAERQPNTGEGRVPHLGDAVLGLAAPAGIAWIAGQSLHTAAGETLTLASGQDSQLAVAGYLRVHSGQAIGWLVKAIEGQGGEVGLSLVSGEGKLEFEAQNNVAKFQAKQQLKMVSANADVEFAAGKTVHLATSGGASITIEGGNISVACPGEIKVHAAKKSFVGPANLPYGLPLFPESVCVECMLKAASSGAPFAALQ